MKRSIIIAVMLVWLCSSGLVLAKSSFWAQTTAVKGDVYFQESGKSEKSVLTLGKVLHKGDIVAASEKSRASFLLSDGSILVVKPGTEIVLKKDRSDSDPSLVTVAKNLSKTLLSREGNNPMMKHLGGLRSSGKNIALSPNKTAVSVDSVKFVWLSKPLVKKYIFTLMGPDDMFIEETTENTEITVSPDKLVHGATYWWEIRDGAMKNSITSLGSGSFTTLDEKAEAEISTLTESIEKAYPLSAEEGDTTGLFLTYQIYREKGMNLNALMVLNKMIEVSPNNDELLRWKSELVSSMGIEDGDVQYLSAS